MTNTAGPGVIEGETTMRFMMRVRADEQMIEVTSGRSNG
jgi:hypothetical protein